jgi:hypothetical protein
MFAVLLLWAFMADFLSGRIVPQNTPNFIDQYQLFFSLLPWNQCYRLRLDRTDILAIPATVTELRIDSDTHSRDQFDGFRFTTFNAGDTAAIARQATFIECLCHHIGTRF